MQDLAYRRFHADQWLEGSASWLPPGAWQACSGEATIEPGERIWVGVDVGGERSASAVVWVTEDLRLDAAIYQGDEAVLTCAEKVRELAAEFAVREVAYDPSRFEAPALQLEADGLLMVKFPQSPSRMIPASDRLYRAIIEARLTHPNDRALNAHIANAVAHDSPRGWRLDKPHGHVNIDGAIALAMAIERAEEARADEATRLALAGDLRDTARAMSQENIRLAHEVIDAVEGDATCRGLST